MLLTDIYVLNNVLQGSPDSQKIRTPRTLAPLKRGCRNSPVLLCLKAPCPLKPIGLFPQSTDRSVETEKASREDIEGQRDRDDCEGSCPSGRQGPLGIEDTNRDNSDQESVVDSEVLDGSSRFDFRNSSVFECAANPRLEVAKVCEEPTGVTFEEGIRIRSLFDDKENCEFQHTNTEITRAAEDPQMNYADEAQAEQKIVCSENPSIEASRAEQSHPESHPSTGDTRDIVNEVKIRNSHGEGDTEHLLVPTVNATMAKEEHVPEAKSQITRFKKDRKGSTLFQTNNSFNVLAFKTPNKKTSAVPFHVKNQDGKHDLINKNVSKGIHTNIEQAGTRKRVTELVKPKRGNADKKRLSNIRCLSQKHLNQKEQNRTKPPHLPKSEIVGPLKAKSAVDYITYNDMFHEIMKGDDGLAIFEMFATPLYDNLRVTRSSERQRQVQSAPPIKTHIQNFKNRCPKIVERKKKKQADKSKQKRNRDIVVSGMPCNALILKEDNTESFPNSSPMKPEAISCVEANEEIDAPQGDEQTLKGHVLSIIEEALSQTSSKAHMLGNQLQGKYLGMSAEKRKASLQLTASHQDVPEESEVKVDPDTECSQSSKFTSSQVCPAQPKVNTWTSSSKDRTCLTLFQTYGAEGEEEPLTDELMQCLVDELISLEEREIETDHSENTRVLRPSEEAPLMMQQTFHKVHLQIHCVLLFDCIQISSL